MIDSNLWLVCFYDGGHEGKEVLVAIEVPDNISQYWIPYLASQN